MERFVAIASGLDVGPALDEIARNGEYWMSPNANQLMSIPLVGGAGGRLLTRELPEVWKLIDLALEREAALYRDDATLCYARVGLIVPGDGLQPHYDGIDGITCRRYQLALVSDPGVALTVDGETKCPRPGEVWQIDASRTHSVVNGSDTDRITILFDTQP